MLRSLSVLAVLLSAFPAQVDFVAVNIGPNPDTIYYVDITSPAGTPVSPPIATLAGNFIRGMELVSEDTGWYVATSSTSGSPTGFFRLDAGASTLVAPLPFTSTAVGGMSFGPNEEFLLWSVDPPVGEDELWRIDFNGTFTLIGPITVPGVAAPVIAGLALDPLTHQLYGIETNIDSLLRIDTLTGAAQVVGPLGVAISAVGGLDFSLDGTNRLFMACPTAVYEVNPATGVAGPGYGSLPGSTSSLAAIPSRTKLRVPPLAIGQSGSIQIVSGPPGGVFGLYLSLGSTWLPVPPNGVIRLDLGSPLFLELLTSGFDPSGSTVSIPFALPPDPGLIGITGFFQAYVIGATTPPLKLTNLAALTVQ